MKVTIDYGSCQTMFITNHEDLINFLYNGENNRLVEYVKDDILKLKDIDINRKPYANYKKYVVRNYHVNVLLLRFLQPRTSREERIFPGA